MDNDKSNKISNLDLSIEDLKKKAKLFDEANMMNADIFKNLGSAISEKIEKKLQEFLINQENQLKLYDTIIDKHTGQINNIIKRQDKINIQLDSAAKLLAIVLSIATIINLLISLM